MRCLVVDDDAIAMAEMVQCVRKTESLELAGTCDNANEALEFIKTSPVDLMLLDVEMPEVSGLDLIRNFKDIPQIILVSGKSEYAAEAFDYDVADFIKKPVDYARFLKAIQKVEKINESVSIKSNDTDHLFIKSSTTYVRMSLKDISWIEALGDYVNIYTPGNKRHTVLSTMKSIEAKLPHNTFVRIHRSYIVNLGRVSEIEDNTVAIDDKVLPVSRHYKDNLMQRINLL